MAARMSRDEKSFHPASVQECESLPCEHLNNQAFCEDFVSLLWRVVTMGTSL